MRRQQWILACSLALNVAGLIVFAVSLSRRGGPAYLLGKNKEAPEPFPFMDRPSYKNSRAAYKASPVQPKAVIFVGDSLTEGAHWDSMLQRTDVLDRGIGGDHIEGVLLRLDEILRHQPSKLFVMIGINDLRASNKKPQDVVAGVRAIVAQVRRRVPECKVFVQSLLPIGSHFPRPDDAARVRSGIQSVNLQLPRLADGRHIFYINVYSALAGPDGTIKPEYTYDNLHITALAYAKWLAIVRPYVNS